MAEILLYNKNEAKTLRLDQETNLHEILQKNKEHIIWIKLSLNEEKLINRVNEVNAIHPL